MNASIRYKNAKGPRKAFNLWVHKRVKWGEQAQNINYCNPSKITG